METNTWLVMFRLNYVENVIIRRTRYLRFTFDIIFVKSKYKIIFINIYLKLPLKLAVHFQYFIKNNPKFKNRSTNT